jgi:hypothetical protein
VRYEERNLGDTDVHSQNARVVIQEESFEHRNNVKVSGKNTLISSWFEENRGKK